MTELIIRDVVIPRIDLASLFDPQRVVRETSRLRDAMREHSFVILKNTPEGHELAVEAERLCFEMYALPLEVKTALQANPHDKHVGYRTTKAKEAFQVRCGDEERFPWPPVPGYRETLLRFLAFMQRVGVGVYSQLCDRTNEATEEFLRARGALGAPAEGGFSSTFLETFYYSNAPEVAENTNCGEHVDQGFLSIEPCTKVAGLEVLDWKSRQWIDLDVHMERTDIIVFCAETLQRQSRDVYQGTLHRVAKNTSPRLSMVFKMRQAPRPDGGELEQEDREMGFFTYEAMESSGIDATARDVRMSRV